MTGQAWLSTPVYIHRTNSSGEFDARQSGMCYQSGYYPLVNRLKVLWISEAVDSYTGSVEVYQVWMRRARSNEPAYLATLRRTESDSFLRNRSGPGLGWLPTWLLLSASDPQAWRSGTWPPVKITSPIQHVTELSYSLICTPYKGSVSLCRRATMTLTLTLALTLTLTPTLTLALQLNLTLTLTPTLTLTLTLSISPPEP